MHRWMPLVVAALVAGSGCVSLGSDLTGQGDNAEGRSDITPVRERSDKPFVTDKEWSFTLEEGQYGILDAFSAYVEVEVPAGEGLPTQNVHMGVFLPDIPGCDWEAESLPEECQVPVVADVGPYYGEPILGDVHATEPAHRLGKFLIDNLVPHGYAVAQVSVLGTGDSGGCMDLMGEVEQAGVQAAVEYLGTEPWSNGAVGLIGRSYDGSTPWEAAMAGSEHLKTVVPISGLYGQQDLMWRNGSAEFRGPGVLWGLYYAFTYTGNEQANPTLQAQQIAENLVCPDTQTGAAHGVQAYATGDKGAAGYWEERSFKDEVLENYKGSVYFIHGMQDWNVDPHMAFPFYQELEAQGLEMKGLFGQWAHNYPDRLAEHENCSLCQAPTSVRYDWAQDLLEWFDHYLKGTGAKPELHVEIQDDEGAWRIEESYPPRDAQWTEWALGDALTLQGADAVVVPRHAAFVSVGGDGTGDVLFATEPLEKPLRLAGMPQFHVTVTPMGAGGQLYAELVDLDDENRHIGHAVMDLRYAAGGEEMQPVVPGQPIVAKMEFFALDAVIPEGHRVGLVVSSTGWDYLPSPVSAPVAIDVSDASVLRLPVVERGADAFFAPPGVDAVTPTVTE